MVAVQDIQQFILARLQTDSSIAKQVRKNVEIRIRMQTKSVFLFDLTFMGYKISRGIIHRHF